MKGACEAVEKALTSDKDGRCRNRLLSIRRKSCAGLHVTISLTSYVSILFQLLNKLPSPRELLSWLPRVPRVLENLPVSPFCNRNLKLGQEVCTMSF